jgi:hypothetical protein
MIKTWRQLITEIIRSTTSHAKNEALQSINVHGFDFHYFGQNCLNPLRRLNVTCCCLDCFAHLVAQQPIAALLEQIFILVT